MGVIASTAADVIYLAARQAKILKRPQGGLSPSWMTDALTFLNATVDEWQALFRYAWTTTFTLYTLTPGHTPYNLGPGLSSPDFATVNNQPRPPRVEGCALVLNNISPPVDSPILNIRDRQWWLYQRIKGLTTNVPTDLYYEPDFPNGQLNFWPVPNFAYQIRLETWVALVQFAATSSAFVAPPGYLNALSLSLAEILADVWDEEGFVKPADLPRRAAKARAAVQSNNSKPQTIASADWGTMGRVSTGDFNYYVGGPNQ